MKTILLTGGNGLVGSRIIELLGKTYAFIAPSSQELDLMNPAQVEKYIKSTSFDLCMHLAAYTNVDLAESEQEKAYALNVEASSNLFTVVNKSDRPVMFFSTDFVFSGTNPPYDESSKPQPLSVYGKTKWQAEQLLYDKAMIVRIAYPYRAMYEKKRDFVRTILMHLQQGNRLKLITDTLFTPTFIDDIAGSIPKLINDFSPTIYHLVGSSSLSVYEAGIIIAEAFNLDTSLISPVTFDEFFQGKAPRPQFSEIHTMYPKLQQMSSFSEGIQKIRAQQLG